MLRNLLLIGGTASAMAALGWWIHRHQRDIDDYQEHEYRTPPVIPPLP